MVIRCFQSVSPSLLSLVVLVLELLVVDVANGRSTESVYSAVTDNPNDAYKMFWRDAPELLEDLTEFEYIYLKVHGCVWSEFGNGVYFDDDGEGHDGDEEWYQSRVLPFRANAAFSLYGVMRGHSNFARRNCRKGTYINTFFTFNGADSLLEAVGAAITTAFPDRSYGSSYCYKEQLDQEEEDNSHSQDSNDQEQEFNQYTTLGCSPHGKFVVAAFNGTDCQGQFYYNTTETLQTYNDQMEQLKCQKVWDYTQAMAYTNGDNARALEQNENNNYYYYSTTYGTVAEILLSSSFACDSELNPKGACPDPYGMKARYNANLHASLKRNQTVQATNWERPMNIASFFLLITGLGLAIFAFLVKNRHKSKMARTIVNPVWKIKKKMKKSIAAGTKTIGFFSTNVKSTNSSDSDTTTPEQFVDDEQPVREGVKKKNTLRMSTDSDDSKPKGSSNYSSFWSLFVKDDDHDGIDEIPSKPTDDSEPIEQDKSQDDEAPTRKEKALPKSSKDNTPGWSEFFSLSGKREVETLIPVENRIETTNGVQVYAPPKKVDRQGQVVEMAPKVAKLAVHVTNGTMTYGPPSAHTSSNSNDTTFGPPSKRN